MSGNCTTAHQLILSPQCRLFMSLHDLCSPCEVQSHSCTYKIKNIVSWFYIHVSISYIAYMSDKMDGGGKMRK